MHSNGIHQWLTVGQSLLRLIRELVDLINTLTN